jgi:hypothetical protein
VGIVVDRGVHHKTVVSVLRRVGVQGDGDGDVRGQVFDREDIPVDLWRVREALAVRPRLLEEEVVVHPAGGALGGKAPHNIACVDTEHVNHGLLFVSYGGKPHLKDT